MFHPSTFNGENENLISISIFPTPNTQFTMPKNNHSSPFQTEQTLSSPQYIKNLRSYNE